MTLDQLRIFAAVAEREHITRAADALDMTQSSVSVAISTLEREFGAKFFHRLGRGIVLTEGGKLFLNEARAILARAETAALVMGEFTGLARGRLEIMASHTITSHLLPARLADFRRAYPGIQLAVSVGNSDQVKMAILNGTIELGFAEGPINDIEDPALAAEAVADDPLVVIAPIGHRWSKLRRFSAKELASEYWVVREDGSGTRAGFFKVLETIGVPRIDVQIALELPSNHAVLEAVIAGAGPAILSERVCAAACSSGQVAKIPIQLLSRKFFAIQHMDRFRSRAVTAFLEILRAHAKADPRSEQGPCSLPPVATGKESVPAR